MNKKIIIGFVLLAAGIICALYGHSMDTDHGYQLSLALGYHRSPIPGYFMTGGILSAVAGLILILMGAFSSNNPRRQEAPAENQEERQERLNREAEQRRLREEELRKILREKERQEKEKREKRAEFWRRHRAHIITGIATVAICIAAGCVVHHISNEHRRLQAERERQEQYERQVQEKAKRDEAERVAREAERQRQLAAEEKARQEAIEAKRRQEDAAKAAAEAARREMDERHKRGIYRIGEHYEVGDVRGIVFTTDGTGQHGKIVMSKITWKMSWNIAYDFYPGWSLPAREDIKAIMANKSAINKALKSAGMLVIGNQDYWIEEHWGGVVYYFNGRSGEIHNCQKTDVRSQPYEKNAFWIRAY